MHHIGNILPLINFKIRNSIFIILILIFMNIKVTDHICQRRIKNDGNAGQDLTQSAAEKSSGIHSPVFFTPGCLSPEYWLAERSEHLF